jgi:hypothetical protein
MLTQETMCPLIHAHAFYAHKPRFAILVDDAFGFYRRDAAHPIFAHEPRFAIVVDDASGFFRRDAAHAFKAREIPEAIRVFRTRGRNIAEGLASSDLIENLNFSTHAYIVIEQGGHEFVDIDVGGQERRQPVGHHGDENVPDVPLEFIHKRWTFVCKGHGLVAFHAESLTVL